MRQERSVRTKESKSFWFLFFKKNCFLCISLVLGQQFVAVRASRSKHRADERARRACRVPPARQIATRLRRLHNAETVLVIRPSDIRRVITGDLQKHAAVRATLVRLAGRM